MAFSQLNDQQRQIVYVLVHIRRMIKDIRVPLDILSEWFTDLDEHQLHTQLILIMDQTDLIRDINLYELEVSLHPDSPLLHLAVEGPIQRMIQS